MLLLPSALPVIELFLPSPMVMMPSEEMPMLLLPSALPVIELLLPSPMVIVELLSKFWL